MDLTEAIKHAIDGNAVLFVGSGFSFGATSLSGDSPLSGRAFARHLYEAAGVEAEDSDLSIASQMYVAEFGEARLAQVCREMFTIRAAADHHRKIASLPWQRIYTTNYDDLIEKAAGDTGAIVTSVTPSDPPERFLSSGRVCLHINGLITRLAVGDLSSNFKLTFESYLRDALEGSPWQSLLRQDFRLARAVIFVGYSMYDLDLARIAHAEDIKDKAIFIASPSLKQNSPDSLRLPLFGDLLKIGVTAFAEEVANVSLGYAAKPQSEDYIALQRINPTISIAQPSNADVEKLFLYGDLKPELLGSNSSNSASRYYVIDRREIASAVASLNAGQDVVLTSELGNGKTVALRQISVTLSEHGWSVFNITQDSKLIRRELSHLISANVPTILLIDGYIPFIELIDYVALRRIGKQIRFLLTSRSHVHELYLDRLETALKVKSVAEYDLNMLAKEDARCLVSMIDTYGLWAEFSSRPDTDRLKLIAHDSGGQFHQVLLKLYEAPQIATKVKALFDEIRPSVRKVAIAIFILKAAGFNLEKALINDLLEDSALIRLSNNDRESVRFLWADSGGYIRLKSSVLAEYYLTSQGDAGEVLAVLSGMFKRAQRLGGSTSEYFMRSTMTYSALQKMLPKLGLRAAVVAFYEDIQNTAFAKRNPHYWLQYAIARMSLEDTEFEKIGNYFKAAYSYAKSINNYDTYQIDNHFARFQLQEACRLANSEDAFDIYTKAKAILLKQTLREQKYQPYSAAAGVADFARVHGERLSSKQASDIVAFCDTVIERVSRLKSPVRDHRYVVRCRSELSAMKVWLESLWPSDRGKSAE